jgi:hypothetical protein
LRFEIRGWKVEAGKVEARAVGPKEELAILRGEIRDSKGKGNP